MRYELIQQLYEENSEIREYVHHICSTYVDIMAERIYRQGHLPDKDKMMRKSINYTLEEVAGTATYNSWFNAPVIYLGAYFEDPDMFNRKNSLAPHVELGIPQWCRVKSADSDLLVAA